MIKSAPFARARAMFAAIFAAMSLATRGEQQIALGEVGSYRSRGKGQGGRYLGSSSRCVAMDKRDAKKARNQARHKRAVRGAKR